MKILSKSWLGAAAAAAVLAAAATPQQALAAWQPKKPVEFIIMAGTGGGADQMARLMQSIIQSNKFAPVPFIPINKPGGSGAEALRYLKDKSGDDHVVMITLNSFYTTPLLQPTLGVNVEEFTPIGRMALDTFLLWVNSESDINSLEDWVAQVKSKGKDWKMGGTGQGQEDSMLTGMLESKFGLGMTYVPFPGGGTVAKNLIGKHIDSTVNNPSEQMGFFEAGKSRPLMAMTPNRLPQFPDVPTSAELGHSDLVYFMQRSINAPPGMSAEAQQYYIDLFKKVFDSKEWQDFCASDGVFCNEWLAGDDLAKYHATEKAKHEKLLKDTGQI
ncbi:MAG: tripartite tricarboxylate transporter substrate binding protein [Gammaproteobacteria bacterium]|nr:tripartite tricarboxylate transporter substrate binding protein [Gammaproteobacteria bacterium]